MKQNHVARAKDDMRAIIKRLYVGERQDKRATAETFKRIADKAYADIHFDASMKDFLSGAKRVKLIGGENSTMRRAA